MSQGTQTELPWDLAVTKLCLKFSRLCSAVPQLQGLASSSWKQLLNERFDFWDIAISVLLEDLKTGTSALQFELQLGTKVSEQNN